MMMQHKFFVLTMAEVHENFCFLPALMSALLQLLSNCICSLARRCLAPAAAGSDHWGGWVHYLPAPAVAAVMVVRYKYQQLQQELGLTLSEKQRRKNLTLYSSCDPTTVAGRQLLELE